MQKSAGHEGALNWIDCLADEDRNKLRECVAAAFRRHNSNFARVLRDVCRDLRITATQAHLAMEQELGRSIPLESLGLEAENFASVTAPRETMSIAEGKMGESPGFVTVFVLRASAPVHRQQPLHVRVNPDSRVADVIEHCLGELADDRQGIPQLPAAASATTAQSENIRRMLRPRLFRENAELEEERTL